MSVNNRFIIIRGPSASGKTSVAQMLFEKAVGKTAIIQQDHYRFIFKPSGNGSRANSDVIHQMIEHNCKKALEGGYEVILEGILSVKSYGKLLDRVIAGHKGPSYMFYFNVSFEETARRHRTRKEASNFGVDDMREWYDISHRSYHKLERLIPESFSISETVAYIKDVTGIPLRGEIQLTGKRD